MARERKIKLGLVGVAVAVVAIGLGSQLAGRTGLVAGSAVSHTSSWASVPRTGPRKADDAAARRVDPALASPGAELIDALDECFQKRFRGTAGFGMSRLVYRWIIHVGSAETFTPATSREEEAVAALRGRGGKVGFYLGSRRLAGPSMTKDAWELKDGAIRSIEGPVEITSGTTDVLPESRELQEIGRKALEAFDHGDRYQAALGRWTVDARAVRASEQSCLDCHRDRKDRVAMESEYLNRPMDFTIPAPKLGDPLGVAFYVYARTPE